MKQNNLNVLKWDEGDASEDELDEWTSEEDNDDDWIIILIECLRMKERFFDLKRSNSTDGPKDHTVLLGSVFPYSESLW